MFGPPNVSHVTCHVSHVTCHVSTVILFFYIFLDKKKKNNLHKNLDKVVELVGGGSVINGAYPV